MARMLRGLLAGRSPGVMNRTGGTGVWIWVRRQLRRLARVQRTVPA